MSKNEFKKVMYILTRIYMKINKMKSDQETIKSLVEMHLGDAEHISELQRKLKIANDRIRDLEYQQHFDHRSRYQGTIYDTETGEIQIESN